MRWLLVLAIAACGGGGPGVPAFPRAMPPPLVAIGAARPAAEVRVAMAPLPWWTVVDAGDAFVLALSATAERVAHGRAIGAVRSRDVPLAEPMLAAVRCAWKIVPMGDARPCVDTTQDAAMAETQATIDGALADLRARAGAGGGTFVASVRCFAGGPVPTAAGRLWCEGTAIATAVPSGPAPDAQSPAEPGDQQFADSRLLVIADGSVGFLGRVPTVSSTLGLRYRPVELGIQLLDLARDGTSRRLFGIGGVGLVRRQLGRSRADAILGGAASAVAGNGAVNPHFTGLYQGFVGLAYQARWRIAGVAQPWAQIRIGVAHGTDLATGATPFAELHLGLSTTERRD